MNRLLTLRCDMPAAVRILTLLITIPAFYLAFHIGSDFLPKLDEGAIMINTSVSPGASLELVDRLNHRVEDEIRRFPEVREVNRRTGRSERTEDPMQHTYSDILVILRDDAARRGDVLADAMRERLREIPGIRASFTTPLGMRIDEGLAGTPADISVKFFGPDLDTLQQLASQAESAMSRIRGLQDVRAEVLTGTPQIRISVDREECNKLGVEVADVTDAVAIGLAGAKVSEAWVGTRRYDIIVKLGDEARGDLVALRNLRVFTDHGGVVPISQLARIEESSGPNQLLREAGVRRIAVDATVAGRDLASAANEIKSKLKNNLRLPQGYFHTIGGKVESQERSQRALLMTMAFSGLLMILLLYFALDSFGEVMVILGTLPDAFVGGIVALWIAGGTWNVSSLVGLVGLFGIAVQNGLVLMSQTKHFLSDGIPFHQALRQACISRVRPKLMTAATAILGLLPILLFNFRGTELERPLAVVMIGGLLTSTLFTLLALPTFYSWIFSITRKQTASEVAEFQVVDTGT